MEQMNLNEWEYLFGSHTLEIGKEYCKRQQVQSLKDETSVISGIVGNQYPKAVNITYKDRVIQSMSCECLYSKQGKHCKHMAALLYTYDDESIPHDENEWVRHIINNKADTQMLYKLIYEHAKEDRRFKNQLFIELSENLSGPMVLSLQQEIKEMIENYTWGGALEFNENMARFSNEKIDALFDRGFYQIVMELSTFIFEKSLERLDHSDNEEIAFIEQLCSKWWAKLITECNDDIIVKALKAWLREESKKSDRLGIPHFLKKWDRP